jgi:hypothetical protein
MEEVETAAISSGFPKTPHFVRLLCPTGRKRASSVYYQLAESSMLEKLHVRAIESQWNGRLVAAKFPAQGIDIGRFNGSIGEQWLA